MSKDAYSPTESKIKMVILTKPGEPNFTWYSFLKYNNRSNDNIIQAMKKRWNEKTRLVSVTQVLQFYDNLSGQLIEKHIS